ncbi:MAG: M3 family oligoendopeptidase [Verrucomicrobia bacterium]|nr:M3 family oligoendopeptidase [Verrucomicrobiota bacterium]
MNLLPFKSLPAYKPRRFVPGQTDLADWSHLSPLFDLLEARAAACQSAAELENWILDCGELDAALDEEGTKRYIAMTCHTENEEAEKAYLHFVEQIEPRVKPRQFKLDEIYLTHPLRERLAQGRLEVFDRSTKVHVELFRPENVPLETEEAKLGQQYQKLAGSLTVRFRGEEKTLVQMGAFLEEPDRDLRQEAWQLIANRRLQEADQFEHIFDQLVGLREQIAVQAGFPNYRDYAFRDRERFDYTPQDCLHFHETIEREIMPFVRDLQAERRKRLRLSALRPWDLAVDPLNRPPLRPFEKVEQLKAGVGEIFSRLDEHLARDFRTMEDLQLLDLANRKSKAPGGYQSTLGESRLPFIFMNAVGMHRDVETLLHEAGHAFHALATRSEDLYAYRSAPIEFCEVASMSMELLGNEFLESFYAAPDAQRARRTHLEGIVGLFPWIATVDAFQHWIYTHPKHTRGQRTAAWLDLMDRFGGDIDWSGYEKLQANLWHRQAHIFLHPFYYIEYGIAQLGALQLWANAKKNRATALDRYRRALSLGGSRPLPELFSAAGCQFEFSRKTVNPLVELIREELAKLDGQRHTPGDGRAAVEG